MNRFYNFAALMLLVTGQEVNGWGYDDEGKWPAFCHQGKKQSPIALSHSMSTEVDHPPFVFAGYDQRLAAILKNNGHSVEVRPVPGPKLLLRGGGLPTTYQFDHLHFHWESEHVMENMRFPLEMHMVHYAPDYKNVSNAIKHHNGVAVVGVFFSLSPEDNTDFGSIIDNIDTVKDQINVPIKLKDFVPMELLPKNVDAYYRYEGSLTTPDCNEGVVWTVLTETVPISKRQVNMFHQIETESQTILKKNYRSLEPLNGRVLYQKVSSSASSHKVSSLSVLVVIVYYVSRY